jgi:tRNA dimethylallyltransferase
MTLPRPVLQERINRRVEDMIGLGFVAEVQGLVSRGYGREDPGMNATGYAELLDHLQHGLPLDAAVTRIQAATRQYARRQLTWLRTQLPAAAAAATSAAASRGAAPRELDATQPVQVLVQQVLNGWGRDVS